MASEWLFDYRFAGRKMMIESLPQLRAPCGFHPRGADDNDAG